MKHRRATAVDGTEPAIVWDLRVSSDDRPRASPAHVRKQGLGRRPHAPESPARPLRGRRAPVVGAMLLAATLAVLVLMASGTGGKGAAGHPATPTSASEVLAQDTADAGWSAGIPPPDYPPLPQPGPGQVAIQLMMSENMVGGTAVCHEFTGELGPSDGRFAGARWLTSDGSTWPWAADDRQSLCCLGDDGVKWISLTAIDRDGQPLAEARFTLTC